MSELSGQLSQIRQDYQQHTLDEQSVGDNPVLFFETWMREAIQAQVYEPTAMTLATVSPSGVPSARIVLLKGIEDDKFIFFTNTRSQKGLHIKENPHVALVFFWKELERQIRIEGIASFVDNDYADDYFYSRPIGSQIGAIASPQSSVIPNRDYLEKQVHSIQQEENIIRPAHWTGYAIEALTIEFWQGRSSRLHDRIRFIRKDNQWNKERLAP